ncbi:TPA: hypothetical protein HA241_05305 [Candidatus Woesearchaeota archaeon]|nr:hypothetical protein [Candidatus Woesearchaeota archaeon]
MVKRRLSYSTIHDLLREKCPEDDVNNLWFLYRWGWLGAAPIGKFVRTEGTRLWVHMAYFSPQELELVCERIDLGWKEDRLGRASFDVMKYRQWLTLEETTSLIFYKRKLEAQDAHLWQNRMSGKTGGRIETSDR